MKPTSLLLSLFACSLGLFAQASALPIDNEFVHVVLGKDRPVGQPGPQHEHKSNRVMIYLDSGDIQITHASGKVENQHWKPGDVAWSPAGGLHTSQNVSPGVVRVVEIQLKNAGVAGAAAPDRRKAVIDNNQVRVYRGAKAPKSGHYVAVDVKNAIVLWDKMPEGIGPFVVTELK